MKENCTVSLELEAVSWFSLLLFEPLVKHFPGHRVARGKWLQKLHLRSHVSEFLMFYEFQPFTVLLNLFILYIYSFLFSFFSFLIENHKIKIKFFKF